MADDDNRRAVSRPENAIKEVKENRRREVEGLCEETNQLAEEIKGNPEVVEAIRKLEARIENLEDEVF